MCTPCVIPPTTVLWRSHCSALCLPNTQGMACVGRTKECTIVPSNHYGPIPGIPVGTMWRFRVQVCASVLGLWGPAGGHQPSRSPSAPEEGHPLSRRQGRLPRWGLGPAVWGGGLVTGVSAWGRQTEEVEAGPPAAAHPEGTFVSRWLSQVSESGVHRPHVAGIHGRSNDGAYSLVLAGGYEDDVVSGGGLFYLFFN